MQKIGLFVLVIGLLFSACSSSSGPRKKSLPQSAGRIDEIVVVVEDTLWNSPAGDSLRALLLEEYPGLPQAEPRFDISQIDPNRIVPLMQRSNNILYVTTMDQDNMVSRTVNKQLEKMTKKVDYLFTAKNQWAEPQHVTYLFGQNEADLIKILREKKDFILNRLYEMEDRVALRNAYASTVSENLTKDLKDGLGIDFDIPKSFRFVKKEDNYFWVRQDLQGEVSNIMIYVHPYEVAEDYNTSLPLIARNIMGKGFTTDTPDSYMITDSLAGTFQEDINFNGLSAIETRGLWRMSKDYMGGPFVNFCINDAKNRRLIILDGSVFAPQWGKRRPIRKLENMFRNMKL